MKILVKSQLVMKIDLHFPEGSSAPSCPTVWAPMIGSYARVIPAVLRCILRSVFKWTAWMSYKWSSTNIVPSRIWYSWYSLLFAILEFLFICYSLLFLNSCFAKTSFKILWNYWDDRNWTLHNCTSRFEISFRYFWKAKMLMSY